MSAKKNKASKGADRAAANEGSINIVQNRYIDGSFRDNQPVIRDERTNGSCILTATKRKRDRHCFADSLTAQPCPCLSICFVVYLPNTRHIILEASLNLGSKLSLMMVSYRLVINMEGK